MHAPQIRMSWRRQPYAWLGCAWQPDAAGEPMILGLEMAATAQPAVGEAHPRIAALLEQLADPRANTTAATWAWPRCHRDGLRPFAHSVLEATLAIPAGSVRSYGEIAAALGKPGAARAVGQALGSNPFPILVPCHRVVAAGKRLGGFEHGRPGGTDRKRCLLDLEGVAAEACRA
jgi:methylated-DNA-[protein]-cysteine S-methyltransferase